MDLGINLEIHFHSQQEGSVLLESNSSGDIEKFGEILLFNCYFLRQLVNFGDHPIAHSIVSAFMNFLMSIYSIDEHNDPDLANLVTYKGSAGRKRFIAKLRYSNNYVKFNFSAKGFGLLARGMGYYSPNSMYLLLKYLVSRRKDDEEYIKNLSDSISNCIGLFIKRELNMKNQNMLALNIASNYYIEK